MFARILDCEVKLEKKEEFVKVIKNEVLPILKKQTGFLEILPLFPEKMKEEKVITISLWTTKADAERYEREFYPKVLNIAEALPDHTGQCELLTNSRPHSASTSSRRWPPERSNARYPDPRAGALGFCSMRCLSKLP